MHDSILLWEEPILSSPSLSKSFILTSSEETQSSSSSSSPSVSYKFASKWLKDANKRALEDSEGGVQAVLSTATAGEGIASTSILLTLYTGISNTISELWSSVVGGEARKKKEEKSDSSSLDNEIVFIPESSKIWLNLMKNSTVHVNVLLIRTEHKGGKKTTTTEGAFSNNFRTAAQGLSESSQSYNLLPGDVNLVKYDIPYHISKPNRFLYRDIIYLVQHYILRSTRNENGDVLIPPSWDMSKTKPRDYEVHQSSLQMKKKGEGYPYWKPEVSIKLVSDDEVYPAEYARYSGMEIIRLDKQKMRDAGGRYESGLVYLPGLHVDEFGLTSDKYIPLNRTVDALPLRISFDSTASSTEEGTSESSDRRGKGSGGLSPARWRLLSHLSASLERQKEMGFEQTDIDDARRLIADTNVALLAITVLASTLHLLFEFLTFKNEVEFWKGNKDLTGLSVRALGMDAIGQIVILFFLIESDSSLLMTVPCAIGCLIALWKCQRGAGFGLVKVTVEDKDLSPAFWNKLFQLFGYELQATRLRAANDVNKVDNVKDQKTSRTDLGALSEEMDRLATKILGKYLLLPVVLVYSLHTLINHEHPGWYSWLITSGSSAIYALGFVLMTPQLFLNYKLKSVAHLPWKVLCYRFINTFIDDLFAFIIRMPTMARMSCFRDDVVFVIYLWQRYLYPVDTSRPVEGGGMDAVSAAASTATIDSSSDGKNTDKEKKE